MSSRAQQHDDARAAPASRTPLRVSQPHDPAERAADEAAARAVAMPDPGVALAGRAPEVHPDRDRSAGAGSRLDRQTTAAIEQRRDGGYPLPTPTQERMGQAYGRDFSPVRVHDDGGAHRLAEDVGARAFTVGTDVFFSRGAYRPGTRAGDRLLAHELAHVVQQSGTARGPVAAAGGGGVLLQRQMTSPEAPMTVPATDEPETDRVDDRDEQRRSQPAGTSGPEGTSEIPPVTPKFQVSLPDTPVELPRVRVPGIQVHGTFALKGSLTAVYGEEVPGLTFDVNKGQWKTEVEAEFAEAQESMALEHSGGQLTLSLKGGEIPVEVSVKTPNVLELKVQPEPVEFEQGDWTFEGILAFELELEVDVDMPNWALEAVLTAVASVVLAYGVAEKAIPAVASAVTAMGAKALAAAKAVIEALAQAGRQMGQAAAVPLIIVIPPGVRQELMDESPGQPPETA